MEGFLLDSGRVPTAEQRLLLEAVCLTGADARTAAEASLRLLPLLYERLRAMGIEHPLTPMLLGVRKRAWYLNSMLLRRAALVVGTLRAEGIEVMALKGCALTIAYYRDPASRPMVDADLMVRRSQAERAVKALCAGGWKIKEGHQASARGFELLRRFGHAVSLGHASGQEVDLHWSMLPFADDPSEGWWDRAGEAELGGEKVRVLDPADELLHVCAHGAAWNEVSPIRWIADAATVIGASPELDWSYFIARTRAMGLTLVETNALELLATYRVRVPAEVLAELGRQRPALFEQFEYRALCSATTGVLGFVPRKLCKAPRLTRALGAGVMMRALPDFLCYACNVERTSELPGVVLRRLLRRLRDSVAK
jgi:hypothetical protein